ncbi:hypothetical protein AB0K08_03375 [Citricoccus sp. NPDC055426]
MRVVDMRLPWIGPVPVEDPAGAGVDQSRHRAPPFLPYGAGWIDPVDLP